MPHPTLGDYPSLTSRPRARPKGPNMAPPASTSSKQVIRRHSGTLTECLAYDRRHSKRVSGHSMGQRGITYRLRDIQIQ